MSGQKTPTCTWQPLRVQSWLEVNARPLGLTPLQTAILGTLALSAKYEQVGWTSHPRLAAIHGATSGGVRNAIRRLRRMGVLELAWGGHGREAARYRLVLCGLPWLVDRDDQGGSLDPSRRSHDRKSAPSTDSLGGSGDAEAGCGEASGASTDAKGGQTDPPRALEALELRESLNVIEENRPGTVPGADRHRANEDADDEIAAQISDMLVRERNTQLEGWVDRCSQLSSLEFGDHSTAVTSMARMQAEYDQLVVSVVGTRTPTAEPDTMPFIRMKECVRCDEYFPSEHLTAYAGEIWCPSCLEWRVEHDAKRLNALELPPSAIPVS